MASQEFSYQLRYILVGDIAVGKSCIMLQFSSGQFRKDHEITIGVEFAIKTIEIENKIIKLQIWDTAGAEAFHSVTRSYYKGAACAFLVYDITKKETFNNVTKWLKEVKNNCDKEICIILVGNKIDLENKREVPKEEAEQFALENNLLFIETSAKEGNNIKEAFYESCKSILKYYEEHKITSPRKNKKLIYEEKNEVKEKQKCNC